MFERLRDRIVTAIRGSAEQHGIVSCRRCKYLENEIDRLQDEMDQLERAAQAHSGRHRRLILNARTFRTTPTHTSDNTYVAPTPLR
jgi:hypothetical protein